MSIKIVNNKNTLDIDGREQRVRGGRDGGGFNVHLVRARVYAIMFALAIPYQQHRHVHAVPAIPPHTPAMHAIMPSSMPTTISSRVINCGIKRCDIQHRYNTEIKIMK